MSNLGEIFKTEPASITGEYLIKKLNESNANWKGYQKVKTDHAALGFLWLNLMEGENLCARKVLIALKVAKDLSLGRIKEYDHHIESMTRAKEERMEEMAKLDRIMVDPSDTVTMKLAEIVGIDDR